jgi:hypothetical protein
VRSSRTNRPRCENDQSAKIEYNGTHDQQTKKRGRGTPPRRRREVALLRDRLELLQAFLRDSGGKLQTGTNTGGLSRPYVARLSCSAWWPCCGTGSGFCRRSSATPTENFRPAPTPAGGLSRSYVARSSCSPAFYTLLAHHEFWPDLMVDRLHLPLACPPCGSSTQGAVGLPAILEHDMHPLVANSSTRQWLASPVSPKPEWHGIMY